MSLVNKNFLSRIKTNAPIESSCIRKGIRKNTPVESYDKYLYDINPEMKIINDKKIK